MAIGDRIDAVQRSVKERFEIVVRPSLCHRVDDLVQIQVDETGRRMLRLSAIVGSGKQDTDASHRQTVRVSAQHDLVRTVSRMASGSPRGKTRGVSGTSALGMPSKTPTQALLR